MEQPALYAVFVDNTRNVHTWSKLISTIATPVLSAYLVFSFPRADTWVNCPRCINEHKWCTNLTHVYMFLGFEIATCHMTLTWPFEKQLYLHHHITVILDAYSSQGFINCQALAQALSLLQNFVASGTNIFAPS